MEIQTSSVLPDILIIKPDVFPDERGYFLETFQAERYRRFGMDTIFVQDNLSFSREQVLRGLHYQVGAPQAKLVQVIDGEVFDVAVDVRRGSPSFGRWAGHVLSSGNNLQLFIPEGFAHGFLVRSASALVVYKCTSIYNCGLERGIFWNDPDLNIEWGTAQPILSEKDAHFPNLSAVPAIDLPVFSRTE
jgi:dTDP-4-dehydrorhamnose 3,5-epimerase